MTQTQVTVILPALNEGKNIECVILSCTTCFTRLKIASEIIVINDGSTDDTGDVVRRLQPQIPGLRLIEHQKPRGLGASYWDGVQNAKGEIVAWLPADGENDAWEIFRYLPLLEHVDIVVPFTFNPGVRSLGRRLLSKLYKGIINLSFGILLNYMNGVVMYRKCVLNNIELKNMGFFYQTEILIKAIKKGFLYAEVPLGLFPRGPGKSKAVSLNSFFRVARGYLSTMYAIYILRESRKVDRTGSVTEKRYNYLLGSGSLAERVRKDVAEQGLSI